MICRPGVTTRTFCLKCNVQGEITGFVSPMVTRCAGRNGGQSQRSVNGVKLPADHLIIEIVRIVAERMWLDGTIT